MHELIQSKYVELVCNICFNVAYTKMAYLAGTRGPDLLAWSLSLVT